MTTHAPFQPQAARYGRISRLGPGWDGMLDQGGPLVVTPTRRTPQTGRMACSRRARRPVDQAVLRAGPGAQPQETSGRQPLVPSTPHTSPGIRSAERVRDVRHLRRTRRRCRMGRIQHLCAVSGRHRTTRHSDAHFGLSVPPLPVRAKLPEFPTETPTLESQSQKPNHAHTKRTCRT